ncbi:MAG: DNA-protecting protein DprA [bacterium]|nr:DNA-protecting protein DprA [bacterium]
MTKNELTERLTDSLTLLQVPGIGKGRYNRLIQKFGSPSAALAASVHDLEAVPFLSHGLATAIKQQADPNTARATAARIFQLGWDVLFPDILGYPVALSRIPDPPPILFRMGDPIHEDDKLVGIVGTRHPSERGKLFTAKLAADLARAGITVVSGMAEGIDSAAHSGALDAGGKTIAVWGTSLDIVYPPTNKKLAERIAKQGAVYSEYLPGTSPDKAFFPERNRIISGLSEAIIVIEAGAKSGALITADHAIEQGRELFAVPGFPDALTSLGTNSLIKKGARLLTGIQDLFDDLPVLPERSLPGGFSHCWTLPIWNGR